MAVIVHSVIIVFWCCAISTKTLLGLSMHIVRLFLEIFVVAANMIKSEIDCELRILHMYKARKNSVFSMASFPKLGSDSKKRILYFQLYGFQNKGLIEVHVIVFVFL